MISYIIYLLLTNEDEYLFNKQCKHSNSFDGILPKLTNYTPLLLGSFDNTVSSAQLK